MQDIPKYWTFFVECNFLASSVSIWKAFDCHPALLQTPLYFMKQHYREFLKEFLPWFSVYMFEIQFQLFQKCSVFHIFLVCLILGYKIKVIQIGFWPTKTILISCAKIRQIDCNWQLWISNVNCYKPKPLTTLLTSQSTGTELRKI